MPCRLRRLAASDLERVRQWRMLPEITRYMYSDPVISSDDQQRWFERIQASVTDRVWIIELLDSAQPVGLLTLSEIDPVHRRCAWAYYVAEPAARGVGLAKPLECSIYDFVFDRLGMNRLWCEVLSFNNRVVSLHERFGSKVEGVLRQHILKNGEYHDVVRMAILKDDWHALRSQHSYTSIPIDA
jgi:UDP-4-amino-4,6-dideoxy-N-acetyl-beta-L-altrosamine N-acetyltransferase